VKLRYGYRLALDHLERAERLFKLNDWVGAVSSSQLAIENFAKAVIAVFEVPTWSHDPSNQLENIVKKIPQRLVRGVEELALLAREIAPEHGRSTYGEPSRGLTPSDIYREHHVIESLRKARRAKEFLARFI